MKKEELVSKTDLTIAELVRDKSEIKKAYNYYNCVRDKEQFKYLEENFGIGQPTAVEFIPLIRKHIDALVGEYLNVPILPKVSCKDSETIHNIFREKHLKIATECYNLLQNNLKNNLLRILGSKDMQDLNIKEQLDKLIEDINENFISEYEIPFSSANFLKADCNCFSASGMNLYGNSSVPISSKYLFMLSLITNNINKKIIFKK